MSAKRLSEIMQEMEFINNQLIDLSNCETEPIRTPGKIQPHGILLVLQDPQLKILQVSQNTEQFFGITAESLLGQDLDILFSRQEIDLLYHCISQENLEYFNPLQFTVNFLGSPLLFEGIIHRSDGVLILELERKISLKQNYPVSFYHLLKTSIAKISNAASFQESTDILVRELRQMTGYDRVMIYRFESDDSGIVIAEDKKPELEAYLGLHYPATDIPKQARKLYFQNWLRIIVDINYQPVQIMPTNNPLTDRPLDLSSSILRSVSPIHIEYLQNMGVTASLCISLINESKLWGLIVCHHYQAKSVDYETRKACELLGQFMSIELFKKQQKEWVIYSEKVKRIQQEIKKSLAKEINVDCFLSQTEELLLELVNAQGAVIYLQDEITLIGKAPAKETVQNLLNWLRQHHKEEVFYTDSLAKIYPQAEEYKEQVSGLLAISIFLDRTCYQVVWFRPEIIQTVNWGGNPNQPVTLEENGGLRLSPRKSFALWKETVIGKSLVWNPLEIDAALELRNTLMLALLEVSQAALEKAANRAQIANRAKSEFLANMSHEIRTPMNAILGFCDLLQGLVTEPKQRTYVESISASGKALLDLINDILDLSKIEAGKLELKYDPLDLRALVEEVLQIFSQKASEKNLSLLAEIDETLPTGIIFDEVRLRQILFNTIGNALKFTEQGYVKISLRCQTYLDRNTRKAWLQIAVQDTGIGIAPAQRQRIFEAFVQSEGQSTRKYGGTGLGLAITRRLTTMLGGTLLLKSELGKGSTFIFVFPDVTLTDSMTKPVGDSQLNANLEQFQPSVLLVVDDVKSNRDLIAGYFEGTRHRLLFAKDGLEGIQMAQTHHPDVILLDLRMPNLDGDTAARRLKQDEKTQNIPIIILTASVMGQDYKDLQNFCEGFLLKPVNRSQLVEQLQKILPQNQNVYSGNQKSAVPESLPEAKEKLPELLSKLLQEENTAWQQLRKTMRRRELQAFAERLRCLATEYQCAALLDYATRLETQLSTFDWAHLPMTIEAFPLVRQSLV
ncbi:ATP-binding protein [Aerosakkonema funiforme]|uniref:ATP-binding protein n=1 Tax=Aerosakkonema funiforme TaxID=1246630 RepID=UPI0035B8028A